MQQTIILAVFIVGPFGCAFVIQVVTLVHRTIRYGWTAANSWDPQDRKAR